MPTEELKFDYDIRFRGNITVTTAAGETRSAPASIGPGGRARGASESGCGGRAGFLKD